MKHKMVFLVIAFILVFCCSAPVAADAGEGIALSGDTILMALGIGFVLALVTCLMVKRSMKTARIQNVATEYITEEGVDYRIREDHFTHTTRTVVKIPKKDD